MPEGYKATYLKIMASYCPQKAEKERVQCTVSRDRIDYKGKVSTTNAKPTNVKLFLNSTISTGGARFMSYYLKDIYLGTPSTCTDTCTYLAKTFYKISWTNITSHPLYTTMGTYLSK